MIKILVINGRADLKPCLLNNRLSALEVEFDYCSGIEAARKKIADSEEYQIIIADAVLIDRYTNQHLNHLIMHNPVTKIILLFDTADMSVIRDFMNLGMYDFLLKPLRQDDLIATLKKAIREIRLLVDVLEQHDHLVYIEQELEVARSVQRSFLKMRHPYFPQFPAIDMYGHLISSREVGGDFFDTFMLDAGHLGIVIGDVAGKGLPAALEMARIKITLQALAVQHDTPDACLNALNALMFSDKKPEMPVAIFYAILDAFTGNLCYCNAGINGAYYLKRHRKAIVLDAPMHPFLGEHRASIYQSETMTLLAGEILVLYSDGLLSSIGPEVEETFSLLRSGNGALGDPPAKRAVEELMEQATTFPPSDDLTCLLLNFKGSNGSAA